jgi:hypothetical protein
VHPLRRVVITRSGVFPCSAVVRDAARTRGLACGGEFHARRIYQAPGRGMSVDLCAAHTGGVEMPDWLRHDRKCEPASDAQPTGCASVAETRDEPEPGVRLVDGEVLYSDEWLDEVIDTDQRPPDEPSTGRGCGREEPPTVGGATSVRAATPP